MQCSEYGRSSLSTTTTSSRCPLPLRMPSISRRKDALSLNGELNLNLKVLSIDLVNYS